MQYNFDEVIDRKGTDTYKHDYMGGICNGADTSDLIPMWVADMEFRTPQFVFDAIQKRLSQGILGYTAKPAPYYKSICEWNTSQYGMEVAPKMINYIPGVVSGIYMALMALTEKGDKVLIQEPVYHPFRIVPTSNDRQVVMSPLKRTETSFEMDFDVLEKDIQGCKMMILCNPHNPGGVCWSKETLQRVAEICAKNNVVVVSDEIHCDMLFGGRKHIPFASVSDTARNISITLQAPTKTFNLPGVVAAHAIVFNDELRDKYFGYIQGSDMDLGNVFAFDCVKACYSEQGLEWKAQMLEYVDSNINYLIDTLAKNCPKIKVIRPQASFLVFLDCREMEMKQTDLIDFFVQKAHIAMNPGDMFGPGGKGYMRMNVACPKSMMEKALNQIVEAYNEV